MPTFGLREPQINTLHAFWRRVAEDGLGARRKAQAREQLALLALSARIDDTSLLDEIERNTDELEERSRERTRADRPPAPTPRPIILTVRAGAGGRDAQAFAARLLRMYVRYAQRTRTRHTLLHAEHTNAGTRSATLRVHPRPGQRWHTEHGMHRITHLSGNVAQRQDAHAAPSQRDPRTGSRGATPDERVRQRLATVAR